MNHLLSIAYLTALVLTMTHTTLAAPWQRPTVQLPKDLKHPYVACTPDELARLRAAYAGAGPERERARGRQQQVRERVLQTRSGEVHERPGGAQQRHSEHRRPHAPERPVRQPPHRGRRDRRLPPCPIWAVIPTMRRTAKRITEGRPSRRAAPTRSAAPTIDDATTRAVSNRRSANTAASAPPARRTAHSQLPRSAP